MRAFLVAHRQWLKRGLGNLAACGLDHLAATSSIAVGSSPAAGASSAGPAQDIEAVGGAVRSDPWIVPPRLARTQVDRVGADTTTV